MRKDVFTHPQTKRLIANVASQYGSRLEFLWEKLPQAAVYRVPSNRKWYAVIMTIPRYKLTGQSQEPVDVLDLRYQRDELPDLLAHQPYIYPGWHMNKDNWLSVILDDSLTDEQVMMLLENSYQLAAGKK